MRRLGWLVVAFVLCVGRPASAAIALVNFDSGANSGSANTIATAGKVTTSGNMVAAGICWFATTGTVNSVTDTGLNTYVQATGALIHGTGDTCDIWYAKNITGNASNVVTANLSGAQTFRSIHILQYSGADPTAPFEIAATGTGTGPSVTSSAFSPAAAGNVNVAFASFGNTATWAAGTNYALEIAAASPDRASEDRVNAPSGSQTASITSGGTNALIITVGSFKPTATSTCGGRLLLLGVGC